jgi:hypothetical protein
MTMVGMYDAYYNLPPCAPWSFDLSSGLLVSGNVLARDEVTLWQCE